MVEIGDTDQLSREELENVIGLQMRAIQVLAAWYLRAVERVDRTDFEMSDFLQRRDDLIDVATKDAYNFIEQENKKGLNRNEIAERKYNNEHEQEIYDHYNRSEGPPNEPPQPPP